MFQTAEDTQISLSASDKSKKKLKRKKKDDNCFLSSAIDPLETISTKTRSDTDNKTEFDIFGQSIAMQLNNMPIEDALEMQLQIQQLLTQHRLKKLKTSTLIAPNEQPSDNVFGAFIDMSADNQMGDGVPTHNSRRRRRGNFVEDATLLCKEEL